MQLRIVSAADGHPVSGLGVFLSPPFKRLPAARTLGNIPEGQRGQTDEDGRVEISVRGLSGPVQLTVISMGADRRRVLHREEYPSAADLPAQLTLEVTPIGADIPDVGRTPIPSRPAQPETPASGEPGPMRPEPGGSNPKPGTREPKPEADPRPDLERRPLPRPELDPAGSRE